MNIPMQKMMPLFAWNGKSFSVIFFLQIIVCMSTQLRQLIAHFLNCLLFLPICYALLLFTTALSRWKKPRTSEVDKEETQNPHEDPLYD